MQYQWLNYKIMLLFFYIMIHVWPNCAYGISHELDLWQFLSLGSVEPNAQGRNKKYIPDRSDRSEMEMSLFFMKFPSLAALEVVKMTTSSTTIEESFIKKKGWNFATWLACHQKAQGSICWFLTTLINICPVILTGFRLFSSMILGYKPFSLKKAVYMYNQMFVYVDPSRRQLLPYNCDHTHCTMIVTQYWDRKLSLGMRFGHEWVMKAMGFYGMWLLIHASMSHPQLLPQFS